MMGINCACEYDAQNFEVKNKKNPFKIAVHAEL